MAQLHVLDDLGLSITGLASKYPSHSITTASLERIGARHYPDSPLTKKLLALNDSSGILSRPSVHDPDDQLINQDRAPSISEVHQRFLERGVPLAIEAAQSAITEAQTSPSYITHMVSVTCTDSANPGYDHYVGRGLGVPNSVEKVLLHGVGCSGGLAALRMAANLALGHARRGKPARVLVVALEVNSTLVRSEMDSMSQLGELRIGLALFSDGAGALVLSNSIDESTRPVYSLLGWQHRIIPDTEDDLGFNVDPLGKDENILAHPNCARKLNEMLGWKVVLSRRIPELTKSALQPMFSSLLENTPCFSSQHASACDFDWAIHPGGAAVLASIQEALAIPGDEMRASYDTYREHGNSSSAAIFTVLDRLRSKERIDDTQNGKRKVYTVACAFGPGVAVEMCMLKRSDSHSEL
ncbi:uncharacterized protein E0L32_000694 [Thyridium curvatum]|uniref:Chalcone synthase n=1 Tax=Thyridium curvatum TaxID=1093900 RepID=A0A507AYB9_9PEZI|nr:uncharacterized protein E0L32_000694 [Thyridium curvatum]TPX12517.1 hypothetical protein E0L32_000694 [Thyridium curvatum]